MDKFLKRISREDGDSSVRPPRPRVELNVDDLASDPGNRKNIYSFDANDRDIVRRHYWQKGPCQPKSHVFPSRNFGNEKRKFLPNWFQEHPNRSWLEYSVSKDAAFCLCCYLFKPESGSQSGGDKFVGEGFTNWKKGPHKFKEHVGGHNSIHNSCMKKCLDLINQRQHIDVQLVKQSDKARMEYRTRLLASIKVIKLLLRQGFPFRGHDESDESDNRGNFLEILEFYAEDNEEVKKVVLNNAPENNKLTSPMIQKDIVKAIATEITNVIMDDLGSDLFSILVDESRDISVKEQMVVCLRYVNKKGCVVERILGAVHVSSTTAICLKEAIDILFANHGLSISRLRGQGYDGASNMKGEYNGLKTLIMRENQCAFYVHCFAHQLQLALVGVVHKHRTIATFFNLITKLCNIVGGSAKRHDVLRDKQFERLIAGISSGEIETGRGLNQEATLKRSGDTRWGSHFNTLLSVIHLFPSIVEVLEVIDEDDLHGDANMLLKLFDFEFAFNLHLMRTVLGISNELSQALQRRDQDILNAINLVGVTKRQLQKLRENEWESFLEEVCEFCKKNEISFPNMDETFVAPGRSRRRAEELTNLHHYRVEIFYAVIDLQLQELNHRFDEINTQLVLCIACLDPRDSFSAFDKVKLLQFAKFYPVDFSPTDLMALSFQLDTYLEDVTRAAEFSNLTGINDLTQKMVQTRRHIVYPLVYLLMKLALLLPVATTTCERAFSAMKLIKTSLRNQMGDEWFNDCLIAYVEKRTLKSIKNDDIMKRFQNMKSRRGVL